MFCSVPEVQSFDHHALAHSKRVVGRWTLQRSPCLSLRLFVLGLQPTCGHLEGASFCKSPKALLTCRAKEVHCNCQFTRSSFHSQSVIESVELAECTLHVGTSEPAAAVSQVSSQIDVKPLDRTHHEHFLQSWDGQRPLRGPRDRHSDRLGNSALCSTPPTAKRRWQQCCGCHAHSRRRRWFRQPILSSWLSLCAYERLIHSFIGFFDKLTNHSSTSLTFTRTLSLKYSLTHLLTQATPGDSDGIFGSSGVMRFESGWEVLVEQSEVVNWLRSSPDKLRLMRQVKAPLSLSLSLSGLLMIARFTSHR